MEVMYLRAMLQHAEIPFHIVGENFGSLYPGVQIASYNERRFLVPEENYEEAFEFVEELRKQQQPEPDEDLTITSKLRMVVEFLFFGWASPGGKKK